MELVLPPVVDCVQLFTRSPTTFDNLTPYRISLGAVILLRLREFCESFYALYFCDGYPYKESSEAVLQNSFHRNQPFQSAVNLTKHSVRFRAGTLT